MIAQSGENWRLFHIVPLIQRCYSPPFTEVFNFCQLYFIVFCIEALYLLYIPWLFNIFAAAAKSLQSCPTLCHPIDGSPPGSSVPEILQARILEWVAISLSSACMHAKSLQLCPILCDPMDSSPPGSSVHGSFQARVLEWGAISFSGLLFKQSLKTDSEITEMIELADKVFKSLIQIA